ncbi:hypothetical protein GCM10010149_01800 [Nonomuraea roseoviolacea subsp. roseoviolacea]|uniref:Uncharacterized protein n=1 Tax=Nonomuraea roseoviolacea subsp. carminata TaxID=160689 RepID=A0ABT1K5F7_9ACTN|nr:hypothetical protein [Nonomuraea roseoviolacea]MCP2348849.1 hypothetical protein [Nonomuraea roseoviolacea subsp. carminata]
MAADDRLDDDELARRLREAHRRVSAVLTGLPAAEKERLARRYLTICDLAKHDPARAAARLDLLLASLDGDLDTPRAPESTPGD